MNIAGAAPFREIASPPVSDWKRRLAAEKLTVGQRCIARLRPDTPDWQNPIALDWLVKVVSLWLPEEAHPVTRWIAGGYTAATRINVVPLDIKTGEVITEHQTRLHLHTASRDQFGDIVLSRGEKHIHSFERGYLLPFLHVV